MYHKVCYELRGRGKQEAAGQVLKVRGPIRGDHPERSFEASSASYRKSQQGARERKHNLNSPV